MLQKTDNLLNIVWCWNNIFVISLYNIFSVYSKYRDRSRKTLPMKHLDSRWKRVTTTGAECPVAATTAAIFTSVSRWEWHQPLSRVSGGHAAAGQLHIYRQPEGSGIIKSILNTSPSWYLNISPETNWRKDSHLNLDQNGQCGERDPQQNCKSNPSNWRGEGCCTLRWSPQPWCGVPAGGMSCTCRTNVLTKTSISMFGHVQLTAR